MLQKEQASSGLYETLQRGWGGMLTALADTWAVAS